MRDFIKNLLIGFAVVILCVTVGVHFAGIGIDTGSILALFFAVLLIQLLHLLIQKFTSEYIVLMYLLEFVITISVMLASWWFFGWHNFVSVIFVLVTIVIVYIIVFTLDFAIVKRDIAYINEQIQQKNDKKNQSDK